MRGGALPAALLFAALAFALAAAPRRTVLLALTVALVAAPLIANLEIPSVWTEAVFIGCWLSICITAACVHLRRLVGAGTAAILALNSALWAGATIAVAGTTNDLIKALPTLLLVIPAQYVVANGGGLAIKVVASWLVAVAILAGALSAVPTPGYVPDHME